MIRNILFFFLTIGALIWVAYAGMNLVNFSEKSNPEKLFGSDDGRIFILNRPQEIQLEGTDFVLQPRLIELYGILSSTLRKGERIFVSEKKAHILLETNNLLSESEIMSRFNAHGMESVGAKKYKWKNFKVSFFKGVVDCQIESETNHFNTIRWNSFDKKSACSIIEFNQNKAIIKDYYQKDGTTTIYTRAPLFSENPKSVDDESLYANYIPSTIGDYHFTEKILLSKRDAVFAKSEAFQWTNTGLVAFEYNSAQFLLMDFKDGYEPQQLLQSYLDTSNAQQQRYTGIQLTENFPHNKSRGFYLKQIDGYVLISEVESALSEAEVALELQQTLARYNRKKKIIFAHAPKIVSERSWNSEGKTAKSAYQGTSIGLEIQSTKKIQQSLAMDFEVKNYALQFPVVDFIAHEKKDLVFAADREHTISGFSEGKSFFNLKVKEGIIGTLFWSISNNNQLVFTSSKKLYVLQEDGNPQAGFPVEIPGGVAKGALSFKWRGKENFLVANLAGQYHWIDEKGNILKTGKTGFEALHQLPVAWISANRLFFGFRNETTFSMIEAEKGTQLRSFPLSKYAVAMCLSNEIRFFDIEENALVQIDQKGGKKMITDLQAPIWIKPISDRHASGFCVKTSNVISCYSERGELKMKVKIPFESVDYLGFSNTVKKGWLLGLIDGLTNNLYLYQMNGTRITLPKNRAQKKYALSNQPSDLGIYTIIDKFVIQYVL